MEVRRGPEIPHERGEIVHVGGRKAILRDGKLDARIASAKHGSGVRTHPRKLRRVFRVRRTRSGGEYVGDVQRERAVGGGRSFPVLRSVRDRDRGGERLRDGSFVVDGDVSDGGHVVLCPETRRRSEESEHRLELLV